MSEHTRPLAGRLADRRPARPDWILDDARGCMAAGFKICMMERCSPLDERAVADLHSSWQFAATLWLSTTGINEMPTRHSSCPRRGTARRPGFSRRDRVTRWTECGTLLLSRSRCARRRTCDGRDCGAQHPVVLERYVAPNGNAPQPQCATREQHPRRRLHPTYAEGFCVHGQ